MMMRQLGYFALAIATSILCAPVALAADFVNQVFESANMAPGVDNSTNNGVPSTSTPDGWHLWSVSGTNRAEVSSTGRTFQTGTNDEALFYRLATPGMTQGDLEGAVFHSSTPYSVLPGQIVYTVMETFSDLGSLSASQLLKTDVRFGSAGNALDYGGFSNASPEWSVVSNSNTLATGLRQGVASVTSGSVQNSNFPHIKYDGPAVVNDAAASTAAFDKTYLMSTVYRPVAGGTNAEMTSNDGVNPVRVGEGRQESEPAVGLPPVNTISTMHNSIDRVTIHFRRNLGTYNGVNKSEFNNFGPLSAFPEGATNTASVGYASSILREEGTGLILNPEDLKIGIKSLRIGATWLQDINLDGVVNDADKAIVQANQSLSSATLLQGDVTNDGIVDASDLAEYATLFGDYDLDNDVDGRDFLVWQREAGSAGPGADGNGDGIVDSTDLAIWQGQYGQAVGGALTSFVAVPEPSAFLLASCLGLCVMSARRQRK